MAVSMAFNLITNNLFTYHCNTAKSKLCQASQKISARGGSWNNSCHTQNLTFTHLSVEKHGITNHRVTQVKRRHGKPQSYSRTSYIVLKKTSHRCQSQCI